MNVVKRIASINYEAIGGISSVFYEYDENSLLFSDETDKYINVIVDEKHYPANTEFVVTFDSDGGSFSGGLKVSKNSKVTKPADPWKNGYVFDGWYYLNNYLEEVKYDFNLPVTKNLSLYAKWKEIVE